MRDGKSRQLCPVLSGISVSLVQTDEKTLACAALNVSHRGILNLCFIAVVVVGWLLA